MTIIEVVSLCVVSLLVCVVSARSHNNGTAAINVQRSGSYITSRQQQDRMRVLDGEITATSTDIPSLTPTISMLIPTDSPLDVPAVFPSCLPTSSQTDNPIVTPTTTRYSNWFYQGGTSGGDRPYSISLSPDGLYVYITGYIGGSLYATFKGSQDIIIEKRNSLAGDLIWGNQYGTSTVEFSYSVAVSPDGGYVCITGLTAGSLYATSKGSTDIILECRDTLTGSLIWGLQYGTTSADNAYSVAISSDGASVYITGSSSGSLYATSKGSQDIIIEKRNALTGALEVGLQYGTSGSDDGRAVSVQSGGSSLLVKGRSTGVLFATGSGDYFEATHNASDLTLISGFKMTAVVNSGGPSSVTTSGVMYECGSTSSSLYSTNQGSSDYWVRRQCAAVTDYFQTSSSCSACPANTVSPTSDDSACTCSASYYNPDGGAGTSSDLCVYCPPPYMTSVDKMSCLVSAVPTSSPSKIPTLIPTATPTLQPTVTSTHSPTETSNVVHVNPSSSPTNRPTVFPTTTPSVSASFTCAPFSTSDTNSALQNFVTCTISGCPGSTVTASVCASYIGDTYLRLYDGDIQVAENDDICVRGSAFTYNVTGLTCRVFSLRQGCYMSGACSGTSQVTGGSIIANPTFQPTVRPTSRPTLLPIPSPTNAPTISFAPTVTPTSLPTETPDVVHIDDVTDSYANGIAASCRLNHIIGICNLRSAVEYCVSESSSRYCQIHLPVGGAVVLNSQWPHMRVTGRIQPGAQFITIVGHGSTLTRAGSQPARVMEVDVTAVKPFSLELLDLIVQGFSGAFYLSGLQSFKCTRVTFLYNSAYGGQSWTYNKDGGALYVKGLESVVVVDSVFSNNFAYNSGGAVYLDTVRNSVRISGSTFKSNTAYSGSGGGVYLTSASYLVATNCTVTSNNARYGNGGGVSVWNSDRAIIIDAIFRGNRASFGGGFHMILSNYVTMSNSLLDGNIADEGYNGHGGALFLNQNRYLTIAGCKVTNNKAQYGGGGFIDRNNDHMTIINTIFDNNEAFGMVESNYRTDGGGALVVLLIHYLTITDCKVTNNRAADGGGGIFFYSDEISQYITITNTLFRNNSASTGGALYLSTHSHLEITNCDILYNHALSDGGGIKFGSTATVVLIASSKFSHNSAVSGGGVFLSSLNSDFNIENSYFDNNEAQYGAGIYIGKSNTINILNSIFLQNLGSVKGGGMYLDSDNDDCVVKNVSFVANMSPEGAGVYSNSNQRLIIVDSLFKNNNASFYGGGVFINSKNNNFKILSSKFENNFAIMLGGGIYLFSSNECIDTNSAAISWSFFSNNFCSVTGGGAIASMYQNKFQIANSEFINNSAYEGGAIFSYFKNEISFSYLRMSLNKATNGGAFLIGQHETISISDCNITLNSAGNNGGGIDVSLLSTLNISKTSLLNNRANNMGGAIYYESDNLNILSSVVNNNVAGRGGGGIYVKGRNSRVSDSSFISNSALGSAGSGSAMFFDESSNILIHENNIDNNVAADKGALVFRDSYDVTIETNTISANRAMFGGGTAVLENARNINLTDNVYSLNFANKDGGGVYVEGSSSVQMIRLVFMKNTASSGGGLHVEAAEKTTIDTCSFEGNSARQYGGATVIKHSNNVSVHNSKVISNTASFNGGGVYIEGSSDIQLNRLVFMNNTASSGGGVYVDNVETIIIDKCSFEINIALKFGGASVMKQSHNMSVLNNKVISNFASSDGGGLSFFEVNTTSIIGNNFERNIASSGSGSGIWFESSPTVIVVANYFSNNEALRGGGAVHWVYSQDMTSEPRGLSSNQSNTFVNNRALYGKDYSSTGSSISCGVDSIWSGKPNEVAYNYNNLLDSINITVIDFYGQLYPLANFHYVEAQIINTSCIYNPYPQIVGETINRFSSGLVTFDSLKPTCYPAGFFTLEFFTSLPYSDNIEATCNIHINFRSCLRGEIFSASYACMPCPSGSYSLVIPTPETQCLKCPQDTVECSGDQIILSNSFWRQSENSSHIYSCIEGSKFCKGGDKAGDESCEVGHKGLLCEECWDNYYYDDTYQKCLICDSNSLNVGGIILVSVLGTFVTAVVIYYILQLLNLDLLRNADFSLSTLLYLFYVKLFASKDETGEIEFKEKYLELYDRFTIKFKIYFSLYQILSNTKSNLSVDYSVLYRSLMNCVKPVMSPFQMQSITSLGLSCSYRMDYVDSLLIVTLSPIFISFIFAIIYVFHYYYLLNYKGHDLHDLLSTLYSNYFFIFLVGSYVILPGVCASIFQAFACQEFEQGSFLRADLTISCESARYNEGVAVGIVMIFVYVVGVPCMYFFLLFRHREKIVKRENSAYMTAAMMESIRPYKFLFASYEPQYWYWEVIETYRRLILSGLIVVLVNQGASMQIVLSLFVTLLFIKLYAYHQPFEDDYIDVDGEFAQYQLFIILFVTLLIKEDVFDSSWLDVVIFAVAVSMFLLSPYRWWSERRQERIYNQKYVDKSKKVKHPSFVFRERDVFSGKDVTMSLRPVAPDRDDSVRNDFYKQYGADTSYLHVTGNSQQSFRNLPSLSVRNINLSSDDDSDDDNEHDNVTGNSQQPFSDLTPLSVRNINLSSDDDSDDGSDNGKKDIASGEFAAEKSILNRNHKETGRRIERFCDMSSDSGDDGSDNDIESNKTNYAFEKKTDFQ